MKNTKKLYTNFFKIKLQLLYRKKRNSDEGNLFYYCGAHRRVICARHWPKKWSRPGCSPRGMQRRSVRTPIVQGC